MKILVVTAYFSPDIGGVENYVLNIAKGLSNSGKHDVLVVTTNKSSRQHVEELVEGLRVIRLPSLFKLSNTPINPFWYFKLRKIIKEEKPDVINAHSPVPFMADMAFAARGNTKFVLTYHAGTLKKNSIPINIILGLYEKTILKHILNNSDAIISVYPEYLRALLNNNVPINFIPPGVDISAFKPRKRISNNRPIILFVGRIERGSEMKGISTLLRAMVLVVKSKPNSILKLVGGGDAIIDYKRQILELGLEDNVIFTGIIRDKQLSDTYTEADMLVLPSEANSEAFGIVLIEAMASGIPVIGSDTGGITNIIDSGNNGFLVTPGDPIVLSNAILSLMNDKEKAAQFGVHGRRKAMTTYSSQILVKKTNKLFIEIYLASNPKVHVPGKDKKTSIGHNDIK